MTLSNFIAVRRQELDTFFRRRFGRGWATRVRGLITIGWRPLANLRRPECPMDLKTLLKLEALAIQLRFRPATPELVAFKRRQLERLDRMVEELNRVAMPPELVPTWRDLVAEALHKPRRRLGRSGVIPREKSDSSRLDMRKLTLHVAEAGARKPAITLTGLLDEKVPVDSRRPAPAADANSTAPGSDGVPGTDQDSGHETGKSGEEPAAPGYDPGL